MKKQKQTPQPPEDNKEGYGDKIKKKVAARKNKKKVKK